MILVITIFISLKLGYHPVAVVILHVHKYEKKRVTMKFKSGGLHERHVVQGK